MKRATLKDLARELGLAISTVSRALHDHPDISPETRERVQDLARQQAYQPNEVAKNLKRRRSSTIGVIVPEIRHHFFSAAISGIEEEAHAAGYTIMVCQSHETVQREELNLRAMAAHQVAGILISQSVQTTSPLALQALQRQGIVVVQFDRTLADLDSSTVVVDDEIGAHAAVTHLLDNGYRRIAHLAGPDTASIARHRRDGYRRALLEAGLPVQDELIVTGGVHENDGSTGMKQLLALPAPPDAVFCVNDPVAIGAFTLLRQRGISLPDDMALCGFSDNPVAALIDPALTTVAQPAFDMGRTAARLLLDELRAGGVHRTIVLPTRLCIRRSTIPGGRP